MLSKKIYLIILVVILLQGQDITPNAPIKALGMKFDLIQLNLFRILEAKADTEPQILTTEELLGKSAVNGTDVSGASKAADAFAQGFAYIENEEFEKAVQNFTFCIENNYKLAESYGARGMLYAMLDKHDLSMSDFSNSLRINPNNAAVYFARGISHHRKGELEKAKLDFNKVREMINPDIAPEFYAELEKIEDLDRKIEDNARKSEEIGQRITELEHESRIYEIQKKQRYEQQFLENQNESLKLQKEALELQKKRDMDTTDCSPDGFGGFRCTSHYGRGY